ncbi:6f745a10-c84d-4bef-abc2-a6132094e53a-CDS [Sclerotinia trifoliorum]|uniref:6f745a10-c84d-4bef-abc2-a6132094e53a-CDS n=1 Tax=Sclerotinia trifoliorum TaxID=28548 RepID=A0A8H2W226_9HELO|nr:6f745a10-c84d-4bef-abc2-a6132094e53a-CDS [Sclerotinia trifoliorum]
MPQEREEERKYVEGREVDLSLFASQNEDVRRLIWHAIMAPETRGLTREFDYRLYTRYPITSQINQESRAMTQTYYPDIWDRTSGMPIIWPPMRFNVQIDSLYITNERHMIDTIRALGKNLSRIRSIAVPSRIIPSTNIVPAYSAVPLPKYLQQWQKHNEGTFPFQTLTHCIIEDLPCDMPMYMHRLSEPGYCAYIRQAVEEFFQEQNRHNPEFRIPKVIVVPQITGPSLCRDCIAEIRREGLGFLASNYDEELVHLSLTSP